MSDQGAHDPAGRGEEAPRGLSDEEQAGDALWSEYEALLDCDQEGCEHTEPGDPLHCWHCRRNTFRLVARKHLGRVTVELRAATQRFEMAEEAIGKLGTLLDKHVYEAEQRQQRQESLSAYAEVSHVRAAVGALMERLGLRAAIGESE